LCHGPCAIEEKEQGANDAFHGRVLFSNGVEFKDSLTLNGSAAEALGYVLICPFGHDLGDGFLYTWILTFFNS